MDRHKRIIDCTLLEILSLGKQLIDYYFNKLELYEKSFSDIELKQEEE